jgi:hypothetical protein
MYWKMSGCDFGGNEFALETKWGGSRFLKRTLFPPCQVFKTISFIWDPDYRSLIFLHQKYVVEGLSIADISPQTFSSTSTVHKYLSRYNLPLRSANIKTRSRLKYGESFKSGRVCSNRNEQQTIAKMQGCC